MTTESQMVALLLWLGWKRDGNWRSGWVMPPDRDGMCLPSNIPPLTLDLMREAETKLDEQTYRMFIGELVAILKSGEFSVRATKEQRLEAFLKTVGKWIES